MRNWIWFVGVIAVMVLVSARGVEEPKEPSGIFSMLKVGQRVTLKDEGSAFSLSFFDEEISLAHMIIEIGTDYVVVQDIADVTQTTIPIYSVKSIEKVRVKGK